MRIMTFGKLAALALVAVVASVAAFKVVSIATASEPLAPPALVGGTTTTVMVQPGDPPPPAGKDLGHFICGGAIHVREVFTHERTVHVEARVTLTDSRPDMLYVWAVRATDPADARSVLFEKIYDDQVFTIGDDRRLETTFLDEVELPLPAGKYRVELTWFRLDPAVGLAGLHDPATRNSAAGPSGMGTSIEIGD